MAANGRRPVRAAAHRARELFLNGFRLPDSDEELEISEEDSIDSESDIISSNSDSDDERFPQQPCQQQHCQQGQGEGRPCQNNQ